LSEIRKKIQKKEEQELQGKKRRLNKWNLLSQKLVKGLAVKISFKIQIQQVPTLHLEGTPF